MKKLLLDDANRLYACSSEHEANCRKIENAKYKRFTVSEVDFNRLLFMEANTDVWAGKPTLVDKLTPEGEPRTLQIVVDRIVTEYPYDSPLKILKHLSEDEPWFEGCFIISARFDRRLFGELLVRPLMAYERAVHSPETRFYVEDGNHRALVYAVFLKFGIGTYEPVPVIFSEDWSHIYPWGQAD